MMCDFQVINRTQQVGMVPVRLWAAEARSSQVLVFPLNFEGNILLVARWNQTHPSHPHPIQKKRPPGVKLSGK